MESQPATLTCMLDWLFGDERLLGKWRSDGERTVAELSARPDMPEDQKRKLSGLFGKLELRYTKYRCFSTLDGATSWSWYRVLAKDEDSVLLLSSATLRMPGHSLGRMRTLSHIHFEGASYWLTLGATNIREFFRRVDSP